MLACLLVVCSGKLESEKEAENAIVHMIENGSLTATISQAQGTVSFETDSEQYNTPEMAARLDRHIKTAIALDKKVKALDEGILTSVEYVQHVCRQCNRARLCTV
jgi:hypothetical protein